MVFLKYAVKASGSNCCYDFNYTTKQHKDDFIKAGNLYKQQSQQLKQIKKDMEDTDVKDVGPDDIFSRSDSNLEEDAPAHDTESESESESYPRTKYVTSLKECRNKKWKDNATYGKKPKIQKVEKNQPSLF